MDTRKDLYDICGDLEGIAAGLSDVLNALLIMDDQMWSWQKTIRKYTPTQVAITEADFDRYRSLSNLAISRLSGLIAAADEAATQGYQAYQAPK